MERATRIGVIICIVLTSSNNFGYVYHLCVMRKVFNKQTNQSQIVIGLADFHDKTHSVNQQQRLYIENILLKKCLEKKGTLIVEDLSSVNNEGRMNCCNFGINSGEGILGQLANKAREAGVLVHNVEYRYCRVACISPLLNNITVNPNACKSAVAIDTASLHKEVTDEIAAIKQYDDGKELNAHYKRTVAIVKKALSALALCSDKHNVQKKSTVAHYCSRLPRKRYKQELEKLCIFDSPLIDMKIMHAIVASPDAPLIIVVSGGSHIEQMSAMLKKIGYESIVATPHFIDSTIKKVVNGMPQSIDIAILDAVIN